MSTPLKISASASPNLCATGKSSDSNAVPGAQISIRVRYDRHSDSLQVRWLFKNAIGKGANSPMHVTIRAQFTRPIAFVFYTAITLGLFISPMRPFSGSLLILISVLIPMISVFRLCAGFRAIMDGAFHGDLNDIPMIYGMIKVDEKDNESLSPSVRNAFWVAETYGDGIHSEIVGCVGIDATTNPDETSAELRRMAISSTLRRKGIAKLLIREAIAHARKHQIASIYLKTSSYYTAAIITYQKLGWLITEKYVPFSGMHVHVFKLDVGNSTL